MLPTAPDASLHLIAEIKVSLMFLALSCFWKMDFRAMTACFLRIQAAQERLLHLRDHTPEQDVAALPSDLVGVETTEALEALNRALRVAASVGHLHRFVLLVFGLFSVTVSLRQHG